MTQNNPMQDVYKCVLHTYNPLHIKDILIHGASRKAIHHKSEDEIIGFYAQHNEGIHHELLDAKKKYCQDYILCQCAYNSTDKTQEDQFYYLRDVVYLFIATVAWDLANSHDLLDKTISEVEDYQLSIDLDHRRLQLLQGGKS